MKHRPIRGVAAIAAGIVLCGQAPASAGEYRQVTGPEDHYAGSQIERYEGAGGVPNLRYSAEDQVLGHDVSSHQGPVDWPGASGAGARFVYVKATEGVTYTNPQFTQQYDGSHSVGLVRGAYHFALPDVSSGAAQANYFVDHGGGWAGDGKTLPGALDAEYNPYGETCYGKDAAGMVAWIRDFVGTYRARTGRAPMIYTSTNWWRRCTGDNGSFGDIPLWLARYDTQVGPLPASWATQTIWQFANHGALPGDQNWFNGPLDRLRTLARG
ncbi:lysozyme [Amycolatopsis sp. NPDC059027]|uniref:lysozyme n=1 Tax=unclassified Amycolatopsis TaxID=2618356 RepID=UPI00366A8583